MLLVVDTSGRNGTVALARADQGSTSAEVQVIDSAPLAGGTFSAQLVPQIAHLLGKHNFRKSEIDAFVVVSGPGSFTGLRVGLAAIKALAEILHKPIVPVSMLEVLAVAAGKHGRIAAVLDAGRGQVYLGEYDVDGNAARLHDERLVAKQDLPEAASGLTLSTTDHALATVAQDAGASVVEVETVKPQMIAAVGWTRLQARGTVSPEHLDANYIRRSDEIFAKPASSS
jgi:tRNA threonylcarbamoyladenosine biosynthesis protein TsaB